MGICSSDENQNGMDNSGDPALVMAAEPITPREVVLQTQDSTGSDHVTTTNDKGQNSSNGAADPKDLVRDKTQPGVPDGPVQHDSMRHIPNRIGSRKQLTTDSNAQNNSTVLDQTQDGDQDQQMSTVETNSNESIAQKSAAGTAKATATDNHSNCGKESSIPVNGDSLSDRKSADTVTQDSKLHMQYIERQPIVELNEQENERRKNHWNDIIVIQRLLRDAIYGGVKLGVNKETGERVALKMSKRDQLAMLIEVKSGRSQRKMLEDPIEEARYLSILNQNGGHPNVMKMYDHYFDVNEHTMILEFCENDEFFAVISNSGRLPALEARKKFKQIVSGLHYIHQHKIVHLDLSMENILVDHNDDLKICDFGMAREFEHEDEIFVNDQSPGKIGYQAPEVFEQEDFNGIKADVWSLGVILFIMLAGSQPYKMPSSIDKRFKYIMQGKIKVLLAKWKLLGAFPSQAIDLLNHMLCHHSKRFTLLEVMNHPWLTYEVPERVLNPHYDSKDEKKCSR